MAAAKFTFSNDFPVDVKNSIEANLDDFRNGLGTFAEPQHWSCEGRYVIVKNGKGEIIRRFNPKDLHSREGYNLKHFLMEAKMPPPDPPSDAPEKK